MVQMMSLPHVALDYSTLVQLSQAADKGELDSMEDSMLSLYSQQPQSRHRLQ